MKEPELPEPKKKTNQSNLSGAKPHLIITSGPTREFIDSIRFLSNPSTGRMGYHIARAGVNLGYQVTYIHGPVPIRFRKVPGAENIPVISTVEMMDEVLRRLKENTVLVMAAAPADYRPEKRFENKLKKRENPEIRLVPNPDILMSAYEHTQEKKIHPVWLIGFAAELQNPEEYAISKLQRKHLDMIFLNDVSKPGSGFAVDTNEISVFHKNGASTRWAADTKERLGYRIVSEIERCLAL